MTYRLVGLMSIVLLLSLAASAFLMSHYQDQFMGELARTVSEVGRATLETLESRTFAAPRPVVYGVGDDATLELEADRMVVDTEESHDRHLVFVTAYGGGVVHEEDGAGLLLVKKEGEEPRRIDIQELSREHPGTIAVDTEGCESEVEDDVRIAGGVHRVTTVIRLDEIRAENEAEGLFLRIPALRAGADEANTFEAAWSAGTIDVDAQGAANLAPATFTEEFRFEVPTDDFGTLFRKLRSRSGFVFLGVFLVGTALSAGLATRFTRPVRRLDTAIHRLSEGDLEVQVPVRGRDEMARLGRAFNAMASKLRANRERARDMTRREKLSALGRLAAGVAHDVRNPLHSIGLTLQHLQDACRPEDDGRAGDFDRSLSIIRGEIHRLDKLVENFLQFARSDRLERAPVSLPDLARETVRLVEKEAERRGIEIDVVAPEVTPEVPADAESIRASVLNLVLNGFEAMPDGGSLRIRVGVGESDDEIVLEVADTGRGIPESEQDRVFDFAYTTRDGGNGLGLAMVHQVVVEEHGGRVSLDSRPGKGTRVSLALPLDAAPGAES
jgi:signal transduction histidine kinase